MAELTRFYVEGFLLNGDGTLESSSGKWFKPNSISIKNIEDFISSIQLSGSPDCQWCEMVIAFANISNADTGKNEEVPHMRWNSFDEFKKEYLIDKNIPGRRLIDDESTKRNYQYLLDHTDI